MSRSRVTAPVAQIDNHSLLDGVMGDDVTGRQQQQGHSWGREATRSESITRRYCPIRKRTHQADQDHHDQKPGETGLMPGHLLAYPLRQGKASWVLKPLPFDPAELPVCLGPPPPEGPVCHFLNNNPLKKFEHPVGLGFFPVEGFPGPVVQFLKTFRAHVFGLKDDLVAGIVVPIVGQDPSLLVEVRKGPGVGEGSQDGELGHVQVYFQEKIRQAEDVVLGLTVETQEDGPLHADPEVVVFFNPVADEVGGVEDRLINIPGPGLGRQIKDLVVVLNGMAAPFFFQGDHLPEEILLPFLILSQGIVDDIEAVIVDGGQFLYDLLQGAGPKLPTPKEIHAAGVTVKPASPRGMEKIDHLDPFVVIQLPFQDIPPGRSDRSDGGKVGQVVVDLAEPVIPEILQNLLHPPFRLPKEDGVGVPRGLFRMKHGCNTAADDGHSPFTEFIGDLPSPFYLVGQHHGNPDQIRLIVEINRLQILIDKIDFDILGQCGREDDRAMGREMELRLAFEVSSRPGKSV